MDEARYRASASAKIILCGEHAVVYGRPAIAVPVSDVRTHAELVLAPAGSFHIHLPDLGESWTWTPDQDHPVAVVIGKTLDYLHMPPPSGTLTIHSDIPLGGGLGSSASVATAIVRVLAQVGGRVLPTEELSTLVYEGEKLWHGTPSGIDNTVIAYERPIWFVRGEAPIPFSPARPFTLVIADSGVSAPTREVVGDVRARWQADPVQYEVLFDAIADVVHRVHAALLAGTIEELGPLLNENQRLLTALGVSSPELERLIAAAREAGALGAKLVGAGRGGNMIALVQEERVEDVVHALLNAGAARTLVTRVAAE